MYVREKETAGNGDDDDGDDKVSTAYAQRLQGASWEMRLEQQVGV